MARRPCHATAALAGGQARRDGLERQASSRVLRVSHRRGQHRLSGQAAHPLSQRCPRETEIMGGVQGKWPAWPGGGAGLGIWAVPLSSSLQKALLSSLGGLPATTQFPPTLPKSELPQPLLAHILLSRVLGSHPTAASMWPKPIIHHSRASPPPIWVVCGTHTDVHMHPRTYTHLLTPKGPDKHLVEKM